jgi:salicylate hydroxylase
LPHSARSPVVRMWLGPGAHFVCYPVSGGEQISFAATTPFSNGRAESWPTVGGVEELMVTFGQWTGLVSDVVAAVETVRRWALHDREPLTRWTAHRLTVLGDAAHPMLPFMAQGANQAVEDALDLASCLASAKDADLPTVLARYERLRAPRTNTVQRQSRENAAMLHLSDGQEQRWRDDAMRRNAGIQHRAWLYGYETGLDLTVEAQTH